MNLRYFESRPDPQSPANRFWLVAQQGCGYQLRQGKVGDLGKIQVKTLKTVESCQAEIEKLIAKHRDKGYEEVDLSSSQGILDLEEASLLSLVLGDHLPSEILQWAARRQEHSIQLQIADHPLTPGEALEPLRQSPHPQIVELVQLRVTIAPDPPESWQEQAEIALQNLDLDPKRKPVLELGTLGLIPTPLIRGLDLDLRKALAKHSDTHPDLLAELGQDPHSEVRCLVADHNNTPGETLEQMATDQAMDVRANLAKNPHLPIPAVNLLADDPYEKVRRPLLERANLPGNVIFKLNGNKEWVANNPTTPSRILAQLLKESPPSARGLQMFVASNPNATSEILDLLASNAASSVRAAVAQHPNASTTALIEILCYQHPPKDLENRDPQPPIPIQVGDQQRWLEDPIFATDEDALAAAAAHPRLPTEVRDQLAQHLLQILKLNHGLEICEGVMSNPTLSESVLLWWGSDEFKEAVLEADFQAVVHQYARAQLPSTEPERTQQLEHNRQIWAQNLRSSSRSYSHSRGNLLRLYRALIQNPATPDHLRQDLLERLTTPIEGKIGISGNVIYKLLQTPQLPHPVLDRLADYGDSNTRKQLANYGDTPPPILLKLAQDPTPDLQRAVVENPNTPAEALSQIARQTLAHKIEKRVMHNSQRARSFILEGVAKHPRTPVDLLEELARHSDEAIRAEVAANPRTPTALLQQLIADQAIASVRQEKGQLLYYENGGYASKPRAVVRYQAAANPSLPFDLLQKLASDPDPEVSKRARSRLQAMVSPTLDLPAVLTTHARSTQPFSRLVALFHPQIPTELLAAIRPRDPWWERYAVAQNPSTPPEVLQILDQDHHWWVRLAAQTNDRRDQDARSKI